MFLSIKHKTTNSRRTTQSKLCTTPLASCSGKWVGCRFVLYKVGSIIMTKAINALYLIFVHFYALAFLASCSTR
jgi:hypothetical protein